MTFLFLKYVKENSCINKKSDSRIYLKLFKGEEHQKIKTVLKKTGLKSFLLNKKQIFNVF